jgi:ABC-type uncharacterized transport system involved in gliding motility auxiliary subunit
MEGMIRRLLDWGGYLGIAVLAFGAILPFVRPEWNRFRWIFLAVGVLLVLVSLLARVEDYRGLFGRRAMKYGLNTAVAVALVLGATVVVQALSFRHSARWDLTENKRFSLSPQTIQLLGGLKTADPDREPGLARRYGIESYGTIVLETKAKSEKVLDAEEEKLTNGLVKVTREGKRLVYVVQGHGEAELGSTERPGFSEAKSAMEKANYDVKPLVLARAGKVPDDATVVILAGPKNDLFPPELDALDAYLGRGGKVLAMVNPFQNEGLKKHLVKYGFQLDDDLVVEQNPIGRLFGIGPEVPIIQQYDSHPITRDLAGITTLFPLTRSITALKTPPKGVTVQTLAKTSPDSWGETNRADLQRGVAQPDPQDLKGPLAVAAVATIDKARMVVYGTSNLAANQFLNIQGNRDFFLNTVSWLAEEEDQISVRPKDVKQTPVFMSSNQAQAVFLLPVVILPALVLAGGIVAVVRRRAAN